MSRSKMQRWCLALILGAVLLAGTGGCFAVNWADDEIHSELVEQKPDRQEKMREVRIEPAIAQDASTMAVDVVAERWISEQEISKYRKTYWRKRLVIGFFPGIGSAYYSGNPMGYVVILKGGGVIVINVLTLGIATVVSWCFEPFADWEPHLEASLIGAVKTGHVYSEVITIEGERSQRTIKGGLAGLEVKCTIEQPGAGSDGKPFILSQKTDAAGRAVFRPSRFPVQITKSPIVTLKLEVPEAVPQPAARAVEVPSEKVGEEFLRLAWMGRVSGGTVLTDEGVISLATADGAGTGRGVADVSLEVEKTAEGEARVALSISVRNEGSGDLCRVMARTRSGVPRLDGRYLIFGRIPPAGVVSRTLYLPVQEKDLSPQANIEIEFQAQNGSIAGVSSIPLTQK